MTTLNFQIPYKTIHFMIDYGSKHTLKSLPLFVTLQNVLLCFCLFVYSLLNSKIASEMPVPHSLGKYFQHHEI